MMVIRALRLVEHLERLLEQLADRSRASRTEIGNKLSFRAEECGQGRKVAAFFSREESNQDARYPALTLRTGGGGIWTD